jgi:holliday junction DNA helicase RuvA
MLEFISGNVQKLTPTYAVIENSGIGYFVNISLYTCEKLKQNTSTTLLIHEIIREDTHELYGFIDEVERTMFRFLLSVSGVGANTARVILSKLSASEVATAIAGGNVQVLQGIKGIGAKTAQRIIIDLKDKVSVGSQSLEIFVSQSNTLAQEALSALIMLGFAKNSVEKIVQAIVSENSDANVEDVVKTALKRL